MHMENLQHNLGHAASRVLVVDDEAHIVQVVALKLRNAGLDVVTAFDGEEALAILRGAQQKTAFDLVLTDLQMPGMNGLELAQTLASDALLSEIPVLLLTARGHLLHEGEARSENIVGLMHKPFSPRALLAEVVAILAARTANRKRGAA
jgi:CheY-like chemotaxis protein